MGGSENLGVSYYAGSEINIRLKLKGYESRTSFNVTYQGKTQCLKSWCEELGLSYTAIQHCISRYNLTYSQVFDRYLYQVYNPHTFSWENKK